MINKQIIIAIIISSCISNTILLYKNKQYESFYEEFDGQEINITGTIVDNGKQKEYKTVYKLKIDNINGNFKYKNMYLYIEVNPNKKILLEYGNKITFTGEYTAPIQQRNYGGFDYREYLKTQKTFGNVEVEKNFKILKNKNVNFIFYNINELSKKIQSNIKNILSKDTQDIFLGILIGYTDGIEDEVRQQFSDSNLAHILAISGAHVSYITIFLIYLFKRIQVNKKYAKIFISLFLIFFIILTNFSVSVIRASVSAIITLLASIVYRKKDLATTLSIPILILLICNPFLIKSISLILTYMGTISIIIFDKNILEFLNKITLNKRFKIPKLFSEIILKLNEIVALTISAQIFIIPIIMVYYNTFSTVFLFTSILSSLAVAPIIMGGIILIIISLINLNLGEMLSVFIEIPIKFLIGICEIFSEFKYSKIYVTTPKVIYIVLYFILIISINYIYNICKIKHKNNTQKRIINIIHLIRYKLRKNNKKIICVFIVVCLILLIADRIPENLKIYFIDVGQRRFNTYNNTRR